MTNMGVSLAETVPFLLWSHDLAAPSTLMWRVSSAPLGRVPKWTKGTDCKSVISWVRIPPRPFPPGSTPPLPVHAPGRS